MKPKPILFNTPMVQAILAGIKTQTRRVVKTGSYTPAEIGRNKFYTLRGELNGKPGAWAGFYCDRDVFDGRDGKQHIDAVYAKLPYQPGDVLYVRETWNVNNLREEGAKVEAGFIYKAADAPDYDFRWVETTLDTFAKYEADMSVYFDKWRPSIHMPKEAARIFLRVTDVRVERLQDSFNAPITPILAVQAEGIDIGDTCRECLETYICPCCVEALDDDGTTLGECGMLDENRGEFSDLWDGTIKKRDLPRLGWACNPWVGVYSFERITKEEAVNAV